MNRKFIFGLCAIIAGLVLSVVGLGFLLSPPEYRAAVKIEIEDYPVEEIESNGEMYVPYDPYFIETEFKAMVSEVVLSNVVESLDLNGEWGKRYGRALGTAETINLLRPRINIRAERNSRLVDIGVTDEDPNEAAKIANEIAKAYSDYRIAQHERQRAAGIKLEEEDYQKEEAKILLMQSNVDLLHRQFFMIDKSKDAGPSLTLDEQPRLKEVYIEHEADYTKLDNEFVELKSLQATNPAALREILPVLCDDAKLSDLLRELDDNIRKLAADTNGVGGTSSDRTAIQASITDLNRQIDARINGIMMTLKTKVDGAKVALDALNKRLKELDAERQPQPYWEAKDKLDQEKEAADLLKEKIEADKTDSAILITPLVRIIDPAVPSKSPSGPNHTWGAGLFICGLAMAGFGFYSLRKAGIREEIKPKPV